MCEFIGCPGLKNHPSSLGSKHQVNIVFFTWSIKFLELWLSGARAWRGAAARAIKPCSAPLVPSAAAKILQKQPQTLRRCCISQEHNAPVCKRSWECCQGEQDGTRVSLAHTKQGHGSELAVLWSTRSFWGHLAITSCCETSKTFVHEETRADAAEPEQSCQCLWHTHNPVSSVKCCLMDFLLSDSKMCPLLMAQHLLQANRVTSVSRRKTGSDRREFSNQWVEEGEATFLLHEFKSVLYLNSCLSFK